MPTFTQGTSGLEGEFQSGSEVDFYIDRNMIHIADTKVSIFTTASLEQWLNFYIHHSKDGRLNKL